MQQQIDDAQKALDIFNEGIEKQVSDLQAISDKWSEISDKITQAQNEATATGILGKGWQNQILSGNDQDIFDMFQNLYATNAESLKNFEDQLESTNNIESLLSDYIESYQNGTISYDEALKGINGLLSQLNQNMSATDNLQNIYDYLGTVNGVGADADSILKGIKEGLSVTADNLLASLEQYNKNAGIISEYTSSWQQLTNNVASMLDVLKEVRDNLEDSYDRDDDDDNDNTRYGGGKDGSPGTPGKGEYVNSGPGVYADGIERGAIGSASDNDRVNMIKYLSTNDLKDGETPIIAHEGEVVLNSSQQDQLLGNVNAQSISDEEAELERLGLKKLNPEKIPILLRSKDVISPEQQKKFMENMKTYTIAQVFNILELNNKAESGAIEIKGNIVSAIGISEKDVIYIGNEYADLRDNSVTFEEGFEIKGDFTKIFVFYKPERNKSIISFGDGEKLKVNIFYRIGNYIDSNGEKSYFELVANSCGINYVMNSNYVNAPSEDQQFALLVNRRGSYYDIRAVILERSET